VSTAFCTLFDSNYLTRGLVMLRSLRQQHPGAVVHALCMDDTVHALLGHLPLADVELIRLVDVEDQALLRVKPGRSIAEYCWTLSSWLCAHLMQTRLDIDRIVYLDADLMFFSDPGVLLEESADASITIIEHRFQPWNMDLLPYGRYNVQWVAFRRDEEGMACLQRWRDQCLDWCFSRLEDGRMGDQKYLDRWPLDYRSVHVLQHPGAGVAPWNFANHPVRVEGGRILIGDVPLVFYHFHQFQWLTNGGADYMFTRYSQGRAPPEPIYQAYLQALERALEEVRTVDPTFDRGFKSVAAVRWRRMAQVWMPVVLKNLIKRLQRRQ
jgi:hypothetical protein